MDKHADSLFQYCLEKQAKEQATPRLQKQGVDATFLDTWRHATFSTKQAPTTVTH